MSTFSLTIWNKACINALILCNATMLRVCYSCLNWCVVQAEEEQPCSFEDVAGIGRLMCALAQAPPSLMLPAIQVRLFERHPDGQQSELPAPVDAVWIAAF